MSSALQSAHRLRSGPLLPICLLVLLSFAMGGYPLLAQPATDHPRLWVRSSDLPRLRSWAVAGNPLYENGLASLAAQAKADMDAGLVDGDEGGNTWDQYPSEMYSQLFAFMSLIENEASVRSDYALRARTLLMNVIDRAVLGAANGVAFRDPAFSTGDRSRWWGEGFALTVDWIYPTLSAADKTKIRQVFLRWAQENANADTTDYNHPEPMGVVNDASLLSDPVRVRWSANNYYLAHMRNLGLMTLAFDAADDPGGALTGYLESATGAWLYVFDHLLRGDARGGFSPEGLEYGPAALGYAAQFLWALHTAGQDDPLQWGPQVVIADNPFWPDVFPAFFHSLSPATTVYDEASWLGEVYQPAWFGDGQDYYLPDFVSLLAPLALYDESRGGGAGWLPWARWAIRHTPAAGASGFLDRVAGAETFRDAILYFLLFDPAAPQASDPRPAQGLHYFAPGTGRVLARADWSPDATWFTYFLGWITIDHQLAEGNQFELYRQREWLTQGRVGWDGTSELCTIGRSDYHNALALENDPGDLDPGDWQALCQQHGSQWIRDATADGEILALRFGDGFVYALGDATDLYNSQNNSSTDIVHASRSIVWLEPDHVVVYDRVESAGAGQWKRFWLNTPAPAVVTGNLATVTTAAGQHLFVRSLLPAAASISSQVAESFPDVANYTSMDYRLRIEAAADPPAVQFLNVLEGADAGATASPVALLQSFAGTVYAGAEVENTALLFPVDLDAPFTGLVYRVEDTTQRHLVTGLAPGSSYSMSFNDLGNGQIEVTVSQGGALRADEAGTVAVGFEQPLFVDGFESGDLSAWSNSS